MSTDTPALDTTECDAVVSRFQTWVRAQDINAPTGQHVVQFCAEMWVARTFPCDLGIPKVWGVLRSAGIITRS